MNTWSTTPIRFITLVRSRALPKAVMLQAQAEFVNWNHLGTSVMEISHRSQPFIQVAEHAERDLRDLLNIPDNYKVLFCQAERVHSLRLYHLTCSGMQRRQPTLMPVAGR